MVSKQVLNAIGLPSRPPKNLAVERPTRRHVGLVKIAGVLYELVPNVDGPGFATRRPTLGPR